ncbi:hypothetical protein CDL15_Pgr026426 [Punica granatum]|uniref:Uncharacterized protein n=1 Tax=Punica granatum TaxID=22663 RepID=A0A218WXU4_PUNGR|nr:hypothetical protein CDL15_Pgr026426 [Punica granatum]
MFPYSSNLIDKALAQVILQVVGGHSYVEAILAETIWSLDYVRHLRMAQILQALQADIPDAESSVQGAMRTELQSIREERDRLRGELVKTRSELTDQRELQGEQAQAPSNAIDLVHFTALEGMVNQLAANMNTNMAELMTMLRDQNRASSSYTPPPERRTTADQNPVVPPIYVTDSEDIYFLQRQYIPAVHPVNDPLPLPLAPTAVPLPLAAFLSTDSVMHTLPPLTIPTQPPIYTVPPPTVHPIISAPASTLTMDHFSFHTLQPQISFSYPAPPSLNIPPSEPGTPTKAAPAAASINIPPKTETEQERRMRRVEETIRALQASTSRPVPSTSMRIVQELYFTEYPTDEERIFSATAAYVAQFHPQGLAHVLHLRMAQILRAPQADIPDTESSVQGAMRTELQSIREERDRLRRELVKTRSELTDQKKLQGELAQVSAHVTSQDREIAHLNAMLDRVRAKSAQGTNNLRHIDIRLVHVSEWQKSNNSRKSEIDFAESLSRQA